MCTYLYTCTVKKNVFVPFYRLFTHTHTNHFVKKKDKLKARRILVILCDYFPGKTNLFFFSYTMRFKTNCSFSFTLQLSCLYERTVIMMETHTHHSLPQTNATIHVYFASYFRLNEQFLC